MTYRSTGDNTPTVLSTAVQGGNPPDLAAVSQPGLVNDFQKKGALKPMNFARDTVLANYPADIEKLGEINGNLYGLIIKAANKSTVWYNVKAYDDAGVKAADDWETFRDNGETIHASGVPAYSIGGADGWTLTDLFENIYLRQAGADKYDQLTKHQIKWTDPSVKKALTTMGEILGDSENMVGGTSGALQTDFPTSVSNVFTTSPKGAQVIEGDFVPGVVASSNSLKPTTGYNVFAFPSIGRQRPDGRRRRRRADDVPRHARDSRTRHLPLDRRGTDDLGEARRLLGTGQDRRRVRVPGRHHPHDRHRDRQGQDVPVRPLRPAAGVVRRHGRPG